MTEAMGLFDSVELGLHVVVGVVSVITIVVICVLGAFSGGGGGGGSTREGSAGAGGVEEERGRRPAREIIPEYSSCSATCSDRRYIYRRMSSIKNWLLDDEDEGEEDLNSR